MINFTGTFSGTGQLSNTLTLRPGEKISYELTVATSENFIGTVVFEVSKNGGKEYETVNSLVGTVGTPIDDAYATVIDYVNKDSKEELARLRCIEFDVLNSSDDINYELYDYKTDVILDAEIVRGEIENKDGEVLLRIRESGIDIVKDAKIEETKGTPGVGVSSDENRTSSHKTVLTLTNVAVPIVSVTTGNGVGGVKIYEFPAGFVKHYGTIANLDISVALAEQGNFTDATPEGDVGIGTAVPANADALGTDATDDNLATATGFTMAAYAATGVQVPTENTANFDGSSSPVEVYLNVLIDAADIDDDATTEVLVSGTVTINWAFLGNY